jgi:hypothetical protein
MSGKPRRTRRRWSDDFKRRVVAEASPTTRSQSWMNSCRGVTLSIERNWLCPATQCQERWTVTSCPPPAEPGGKQQQRQYYTDHLIWPSIEGRSIRAPGRGVLSIRRAGIDSWPLVRLPSECEQRKRVRVQQTARS